MNRQNDYETLQTLIEQNSEANFQLAMRLWPVFQTPAYQALYHEQEARWSRLGYDALQKFQFHLETRHHILHTLYHTPDTSLAC